MTYSLFEYAKDHQDELMAREEVEEKVSESCTTTASDQVSSATGGSKSKPKVQLSKAAKRRHADKLSEYNNEREGEREERRGERKGGGSVKQVTSQMHRRNCQEVMIGLTSLK